MHPQSTVLVVTVAEADAVLGDIRLAHDPSGRDGLPAHVTILTPFVPLAEWSDRHSRRLQAALDGIRPFSARFRRTGRFGNTTLFLVPEPEDDFRLLCRCVAAAFPEYPPYGGAFSEVLPHLTLAHGAPEALLDELQCRLQVGTDIRARVTALTVFSKAPERPWVAGPSVSLR